MNNTYSSEVTKMEGDTTQTMETVVLHSLIKAGVCGGGVTLLR